MDPAFLSVGETCDFTAVAALDGEPLDPEKLTWEWDFGDKSDLAKTNPAPHAYGEAGEYSVTVAASYEEQSIAATRAVVVEGYMLDYPTNGPGIIIFTPNSGGKTCDTGAVLCAIPMSWINANPTKTYAGAQFFRFINGQRVRQDAGGPNDWVPVDQAPFTWEGVQYKVSRLGSWFSQSLPNLPTDWEADYKITSMGPPPGGTTTYYTTPLASITPDNSVVTSTTDALILHTQTPPTHRISWNVSHLNHGPPVFTVTVTVYNVCGGAVWSWTGTQGPGDGYVDWPGITSGVPPGGGQPAPKGIYTFKVHATHPQNMGCFDQDKSRYLETWAFKMCYLELNPEAKRVRFRLRYKLSLDASAVTVKVFNRDPQEKDEQAGPTAKGLNWSREVVLEGDEWFENGVLKQPIYCVVEAKEDAATGALNRDCEPKWALPKGTTQLVPFPITQVQSLTYQDGHSVVMDGTEAPYAAPHWRDTSNPLDGDADDPGDSKHPYSYVRDTNMRVTAAVHVDPASIPNPDTVRIRGTGPHSMDIPSTLAQISGDYAAITSVVAAAPFPDYVHRYDALHIDWELSLDNGVTWEDVGTTENEVFVTLQTPQCEQNWRTVMYLATKKGGATTEDAAAANTWDLFAGKHVCRWNVATEAYDLELYYYGPLPGTRALNTRDLLSHRDGECEAWVDLLHQAFRANGLSGDTCVKVRPPVEAMAFIVKNVEFSGESYPGELWSYGPGDFTYTAVQGIPGQNTDPPAAKWFDQHFIVRRGEQYYDPSYGEAFMTPPGQWPEWYYSQNYLSLWVHPELARFRGVWKYPWLEVRFTDVGW